MTHVFGLTGGIASGKTTVASRFARRGVPIVDADVIAREVVQVGSEGLGRLVAAFGPEILDEQGTLLRKRLAAIAFASPEAQRTLNGIIHPLIAVGTQRRLALVLGPVACYDAALIVENGLADVFRPLVVVSSAEHDQVARAAVRDAASAEEVRRRIALQKPLAEKVAVADFVVENDGSLDALERRADHALDLVLLRLSLDPRDFPAPTGLRRRSARPEP